jgi:hypothetical protein
MNEPEFRDWIRRHLSSLDERLQRVEARPPEAAKTEVSARIKGEIAHLAKTLDERVKAGKVTSVAIAFVTDEGVPTTGWAAEGVYFALAGAATFMGLEILEDFRQGEAAAAKAEAKEKEETHA